MSTWRQSHLGQAWLILLLALLFGATLAGLHFGLSDRITANKRAEALSQIPHLTLGETAADAEIQIGESWIDLRAADGQTSRLDVAELEVAGHKVYEVRSDEHGGLAGWVVHGAGPGYADVIELLIGLGPEAERITGLFVLAQKETPALGDGITKEGFRRLFVGQLAATPLAVIKDGQAAVSDGRIQAITAATISSRSVCDIVNRTLAEVRPHLSKTEGKP
jgi:electron transport complex protein RnfG